MPFPPAPVTNEQAGAGEHQHHISHHYTAVAPTAIRIESPASPKNGETQRLSMRLPVDVHSR